MGVSKIWVLAEATGGNVATITLELLAKARQLAGTVKGIGQRSFRAVIPQTQASRGDASLRHHGRGFDGEQAGAAVKQVAPVHQVPVSGFTIIGGVLAHGCDNDPVCQRQATARRG